MKQSEKNQSNIKDKISNLLELPKEIVKNLPLISIIGNEEISIENYKGVIEYTSTKIRINTSCGIFKIEGKSLLIKQITQESVAVSGLVTHFEYMR